MKNNEAFVNELLAVCKKYNKVLTSTCAYNDGLIYAVAYDKEDSSCIVVDMCSDGDKNVGDTINEE